MTRRALHFNRLTLPFIQLRPPLGRFEPLVSTGRTPLLYASNDRAEPGFILSFTQERATKAVNTCFFGPEWNSVSLRTRQGPRHTGQTARAARAYAPSGFPGLTYRFSSSPMESSFVSVANGEVQRQSSPAPEASHAAPGCAVVAGYRRSYSCQLIPQASIQVSPNSGACCRKQNSAPTFTPS